MKALLFLNGEPPVILPDLSSYDIIACTDGAYDYCRQLDKLDYVIGDFDSICTTQTQREEKFIHTPDQNKTDLEKALLFLITKKIKKIDLYGGSGREQDHFLGNLCVARKYYKRIALTFHDAYGRYFFLPPNYEYTEKGLKGRIISLIPFPRAADVYTEGLKYGLQYQTLSLTKLISTTRNEAENNRIFISFKRGDLLIFIQQILVHKRHN